MEWNCGNNLILLLMLLLVNSSTQDRGFVKIDISKSNQLNESTVGTTTIATEKDTSNITVETTTTTSSTSTSTVSSEATSKTPSTTISPATTTIQPKKEEVPKEGRLSRVVPSGYYCRCDLKINLCDVNCCCDIDCSNTILKTFDCDEEPLDITEYHHQDGLQSCEVQGGLFCLVGDHHDEGEKTFYDPTRKDLSSKHKWKEIFTINGSPNSGFIPSYRVNGALQLYNESSERLETFTIPYSLTNSHCQLQHSVRFLRDQTSECFRSLEDLQTSVATFASQQSSVRYLRVPKTDLMEHCMDDDCFNSTVLFCNLAGQGCKTSNRTDEADGIWHCPELRIVLLHNYTHLEGVQIKFHCGIAEYSALETDTVWQKIAIEFKRKNEERFSRNVSGNLGYLKGKPLIVSSLLIPSNASAEERKRSKKYMLSYFTNGTRAPDETFRLRLPKNTRNRCVLDNRMHHNVLFGEDMWSKCNFYPQLNVTTESNFTEVCITMQEQIYTLLLHNVDRPEPRNSESLNLYLSKYGNPVNRSSDWVQFRALNVIDEKVTASWSQSAAFFKCNNMLINANYHIFHGRMTVRNVPRQQVLQEAEIVFGPRVDLQFPLDEEIRVPLFVQVQFFDLTSCGGRMATVGLLTIKIFTFVKLMLI